MVSVCPQDVKKCQNFFDKISFLKGHEDRVQTVQVKINNACTLLDEVRAFLCEGVLIVGLSDYNSPSATKIIRQDAMSILRAAVGDVTGGSVKEALVLPILLEHARTLLA